MLREPNKFDLIHLNLDPFAPIGSNGQYLPSEPITICTSRCNSFVVLRGVKGQISKLKF